MVMTTLYCWATFNTAVVQNNQWKHNEQNIGHTPLKYLVISDENQFTC